MNTDFDKIYLTHKEVFLLFKMRFNPRTPQKSLGESFKTFREYDFILFNFAEGESKHSCKKYDGTVHLSDTYSGHSSVFNNCTDKLTKRAVAAGAIKLAAGSSLIPSIIIFMIHFISSPRSLLLQIILCSPIL